MLVRVGALPSGNTCCYRCAQILDLILARMLFKAAAVPLSFWRCKDNKNWLRFSNVFPFFLIFFFELLQCCSAAVVFSAIRYPQKHFFIYLYIYKYIKKRIFGYLHGRILNCSTAALQHKRRKIRLLHYPKRISSCDISRQPFCRRDGRSLISRWKPRWSLLMARSTRRYQIFRKY